MSCIRHQLQPPFCPTMDAVAIAITEDRWKPWAAGLMVREAVTSLGKPEGRAEGRRFLDEKSGFPQLPLWASKHWLFAGRRAGTPPKRVAGAFESGGMLVRGESSAGVN